MGAAKTMQRLLWLDLLRSAAIVGMIVYHVAYDLQFFHGLRGIDVTTGGWKLFQIAVASLFLAVSGISAGFWTRTDGLIKGWKRGWTILSAAMLVSLATAIVDPDTWVRFGILHLIGASSFLLPFLRRVHPLLIGFLGVLCIALAPFDLMPHVVSVDYVPPIPWLGPMLVGFAAGIPLSARPVLPAHPVLPARPGVGTLGVLLAWPGRHSLAIYLLHQPVILSILWLT